MNVYCIQWIVSALFYLFFVSFHLCCCFCLRLLGRFPLMLNNNHSVAAFHSLFFFKSYFFSLIFVHLFCRLILRVVNFSFHFAVASATDDAAFCLFSLRLQFSILLVGIFSRSLVVHQMIIFQTETVNRNTFYVTIFSFSFFFFFRPFHFVLSLGMFLFDVGRLSALQPSRKLWMSERQLGQKLMKRQRIERKDKKQRKDFHRYYVFH